MWNTFSLLIMSSILIKQTNSDINKEDVKFFLFTKIFKSNDYFMLPNINTTDTNFDKNSTIFFLIHGWKQDREKEWYGNLKNALLKRNGDNCVVIEVDWSRPASEWYWRAAINTRDVGQVVAKFIVNLTETHQISLNNFHLIGHSLGGHVAGFAGKKILSLTGQKLPRITALDPAGPFFDNFLIHDDNNRLARNDAEVVLVFHTDGGKFGYLNRLGTIDVFFNGGRALQPGCPFEINRPQIFCSHMRAFRYYIEVLEYQRNISAKQCQNYMAFITGRCDNNRKIDIGRDVFSSEDEGEYYIQTNSHSPFFVS